MSGPTSRLRMLAVAAGLFGLAALVPRPAAAQGSVVIYCGVDEAWCRAMATTFEKQTGIHTDMTRQSAGEIYARLRAEKDNPRGDIWWGGTGDPHLQAAEENLTQDYKSPQLGQLRDWAQRQAERAKFRTVGIYLGALGFGYNKEDLARRKLAAPACWADLIKPEFKGEVQMADPNSSGTAWTMLATIVQLMGEEPAFAYLKRLNANINEYTKAGAAPAQSTGKGESLIGIAFQHDLIDVAKRNFPVQVVSPCEGTGYEIGSMSLIRGARHPEEARKFYEWALTPEAQKLGALNRSYQIPSNTATPVPPEAPDLSRIKLIEYDFATYGSSATRTRLLGRWTSEVKNAPR
ncbi:ABC transporter substrate-binding protein [Limobrevibacterium gyesilva]|uniref:ABC transporter substrate-binding protein n=1 Tax=Limobrevibacterium gyesilva TaxID=2991712 RepID=A0AA41YNH6_9PROT|nr:ABC transporter substrate-binding protein [Limobrevibacterium gyesilva]MCW3475333.1 ABC transporter substrate-binding protein [Limobrevibacterium gyesilva]